MRGPRLPEALRRHLEAEYPREGCGVILQRGADGPCRVRPMRNASDAHRARTAFAFEPREWLRVNLEAEARGERVVCVYHSHVDTGAYLSAEDREWAAPDGAPLLPGVSYLVVSIEQGHASDARLFAWRGADFHENEGFSWGFTFEKAF